MIFAKNLCIIGLKKVVKINNLVKYLDSCSEEYYKLKVCKIRSWSVCKSERRVITQNQKIAGFSGVY